MCGIVGYIGPREAVEFLVSGLHRLEYRGYDSAGVAAIDGAGKLRVVKTKGRIEVLETLLQQNPLSGSVGIGHTRWATHGCLPTSMPILIKEATAPWLWFTMG